MSKQKLVQIVTKPDDTNFGQILSPADLMDAQKFAHRHVENLTADFLTANQPQTIGLEHSLPGGMRVEIADGRAYKDGFQYDANAAALVLTAADATLPRLDVIVAQLNQFVPSRLDFLPFQQLRSEEELLDGTIYPLQQMAQPTELNNVATITVKTGIPATAPTAPALQPHEILLYTINVAAGAIAIAPANITDNRVATANLRSIKELSDSNKKLLQEMWLTLEVLRSRYPTTISGDGRINAVGRVENSTPVVDLPFPFYVQFGDGFVYLTLANFDAELGARYSSDGANGNLIRINAPATEKALYLDRNGRVRLSSTVSASNGGTTLLCKITPNGSNAPVIKRYINLRSAYLTYTKTAAADPASRRLDYELAMPPGVFYVKATAIRQADNVLYFIPPLSNLVFDQPITFDTSGVANGDKIVFEIFVVYSI